MKSQELTFAFVGLSPALAIVYLFGNYVRQLVFPQRSSRRKYGGKKEQERLFWAMRRVERVLVLDGKERTGEGKKDGVKRRAGPGLVGEADQPSALTTGLLILSLAQLRTYAERHLPSSGTSSSVPPSNIAGTLSFSSSTPVSSLSIPSSSESTAYSASSLRDAFLEDLTDLQDPELGVNQKRIVVERMWRCWGSPLGWGTVA